MKQLFLAVVLATFVFTSAQAKVKPTSEPMVLTTFDTIRLLAPDTLGGKPLMQAISRRKSDRQFDTRNLTLKHLSEIL